MRPGWPTGMCYTYELPSYRGRTDPSMNHGLELAPSWRDDLLKRSRVEPFGQHEGVALGGYLQGDLVSAWIDHQAHGVVGLRLVP